jgi:hypothetical protein
MEVERYIVIKQNGFDLTVLGSHAELEGAKEHAQEVLAADVDNYEKRTELPNTCMVSYADDEGSIPFFVEIHELAD